MACMCIYCQRQRLRAFSADGRIDDRPLASLPRQILRHDRAVSFFVKHTHSLEVGRVSFC